MFVYGTLKRGMINHAAMQGAGVDRVRWGHVRGWRLVEVPTRMGRITVRPYPYPGLLPGNATRYGVVLGEMHRLGASELEPEDALHVLDHLEREGHEYHRVKWWAFRGGQPHRVWVYVYASEHMAARAQTRAYQRVSWTSRSARAEQAVGTRTPASSPADRILA